MNHQDIADRLDAMHHEHIEAHNAALDAVEARYQKECESLQETCGGIGHVYRLNASLHSSAGRYCIVCGKAES